MFIIRLITKLLLIPVWMMLVLLWLPVHAVVLVCGMFHGLGKLFFGSMAVLALCFGMWQNVLIFSVCILITFSVVLTGAIVDALLQVSYQLVGSRILS